MPPGSNPQRGFQRPSSTALRRIPTISSGTPERRMYGPSGTSFQGRIKTCSIRSSFPSSPRKKLLHKLVQKARPPAARRLDHPRQHIPHDGILSLKPGRQQQIEPVRQAQRHAQQGRHVAQVAQQRDPRRLRQRLEERAKEILGDALGQEGQFEPGTSGLRRTVTGPTRCETQS